jgi:hypothetical protein
MVEWIIIYHLLVSGDPHGPYEVLALHPVYHEQAKCEKDVKWLNDQHPDKDRVYECEGMITVK